MNNSELSAGNAAQQSGTAEVTPSSQTIANALLPAALMSIEDVMKLRNQLPDAWKWNKCYELAYVNTMTGREFVRKHWALTAPDGLGGVCSLGLISHDCVSTKKEFFERDVPVQWVEKSLLIVDRLLAEIERLKGCR